VWTWKGSGASSGTCTSIKIGARQGRELEAGLEARVVDQDQAAALPGGLVEAGCDLPAVSLEVGQHLGRVRLGAVQEGQLEAAEVEAGGGCCLVLGQHLVEQLHQGVVLQHQAAGIWCWGSVCG
jgi:hypothetical protein